jgi:O-antigen/teichoic acid export membrane protein
MSWYVKPFKLNSPKLVLILRDYKNFPLLQLPANIISIFSSQLPVLMLSYYFGNSLLGTYSITMRCLGIPASLLAVPINRVYYREACAKYAEGQKIGEFTFNILKANIMLAIIPITILMVFGEPLFALIFGKEWRMAGTYAEVLGIYSLVTFCSACVSGDFVIIGKQKYNLLYSLVSIFANATVFILGSLLFGDAYMVLIFYSVTNIVISLVFNGLFVCSTGVHIKKYLNFIFKFILIPSMAAVIIKVVLKKAGVL